MTATPATSPAMTPAQSHAEVQKLLRAEIDGLKQLLDERFKEIATLTDRIESIGNTVEAEFEALIADMEKRHAIELQLVRVLYASWQNGPADGVPPYDQQLEILNQSDLFDPSWYLQTYPDVTQSGLSPKEHYVRSGAFEGRNPGPNFDTMAYYMANPDIANAGWPALVHYAGFGKGEGRPLS